MSFLAPLFLIGTAAAAIPVVLHLLRREPRERVKFAAVRLLRPSPTETADRRRLRELLLLALRVAALALLAFAFARPFAKPAVPANDGPATIVALDTSLSLSAPGQFARAQRLAREAIGGAPAGAPVGVVTFSDVAEVAARPSEDRSLAMAAVDAASPSFGATSYRGALTTAAQILNDGRGTIVVVTDLQSTGWDAGSAALPEGARIEVVDVGPPPPNLAVTAARVVDDRIVASILNASPEARTANVAVRIDGRLAGEAVASIAAGQAADVALPAGRGVAAEVEVDDKAGVGGDNVRYLVLDSADRPSVLVLTTLGDGTGDGLYVHHALAAEGRSGASYQVVGANAAGLSSWDASRLSRQAAVIVLSTRALDQRGRELLKGYVRSGGGLLVAAGADVDAEVTADLVGGGISMTAPAANEFGAREPMRTLVAADARHPLFAAFGGSVSSLALVKFERLQTLSAPGCATLARFTSGEIALAECSTGGLVLVFASDLGRAWNDFPLHAAFVPFLHETVKYLAGQTPRRPDLLVGEVPAGVPARPGVAQLAPASPDGAARLVAVNVDPAEADADRLSPDEFQAAVSRLLDAGRLTANREAQQDEDNQRIWQYLLGVMLGVMVLESVVSSRST
jgi:hypothetical protein